MKVVIIKVRDDMFIVQRTMPSGSTNVQRCGTEHEARIYCRGLQDGYGDAREAIGTAKVQSAVEIHQATSVD